MTAGYLYRNLSQGVGSMIDYTRIVLLCEDRQQEVCARHFLVSCGVDKNRIYPEVCPKGKQAGEQFVRRKYPKQVVSYRKISHRLSAALVVVMDADTLDVANRKRQLENALSERGISPRASNDRVGLFIPKRNIETWIHFLKGQPVNEEETYPRLSKESECKPEVEALARNRRNPLPEEAPPSLRAACQELPHILTENA